MGKEQLKSLPSHAGTFFFWPTESLVEATQAGGVGQAKPVLEVLPAVVRANGGPPAVFTSTPAAAYRPHQTTTQLGEQQLH